MTGEPGLPPCPVDLERQPSTLLRACEAGGSPHLVSLLWAVPSPSPAFPHGPFGCPCSFWAYFSSLLGVGPARTSPPCQAVSTPVLAPQGLMHSSGPVGRHRQLVLVLEGELYLIPFALLKGSSSNEYLYERFALIAVPSIRTLGLQSKVRLTEDLWVLHPLLLEARSLARLGSKVIKCDLFKLLIV